ncbi:hypothetical protein B0A49_04954 [Cryomyces minteri]|uniref:NmrA-like domain-containing protein n=1 Tax=Cryomyces minteri TaxID=331657 RepID=A0A4U0X3B7_9PEZI|nr:hypothetical protein B0A49_04954 [Cryomyces minteri]
MSKVILITGATGKQGGATVDALLSSPQASDFTILAMTRNPSSGSAQKLVSRGCKIVQGDLHDVPGIFRSAKEVTTDPIWGVFSVQVPMGKNASPGTEEKQGKDLVDEAIKQGVKHFVYTSVERGGPNSYENPTEVPHFISKHNIEHHLHDATARDGSMSYTILRPVAFMDNVTPNFFGKMFDTAWKASLGDKKLQLIAVADIGYMAAQAFIKSDEYKNRAVGLAGAELSFKEANKIFKEKVGMDMPVTFGFMGSALLWGVAEMGIMFKWFNDVGYGVDIPALRKEHPGLLDFGDWVEKKSGFAKK